MNFLENFPICFLGLPNPMGHLTSAAHTARPYRFRWNDCNYQSLSNRNPL